MPRYDINYQAFRRELLNKFRNMDPDDIVAELDVSTDTLMDVLWQQLEKHIEDQYNDDEETGEEVPG